MLTIEVDSTIGDSRRALRFRSFSQTTLPSQTEIFVLNLATIITTFCSTHTSVLVFYTIVVVIDKETPEILKGRCVSSLL
jgi:hypothetical protein